MKIFEFALYDNYLNETTYALVLANSEEEALGLLKQDLSFQHKIRIPDIEFQGLSNVYESDKPKILW